MLNQSHGTNVDAPPNFLRDLNVGPKVKQRKKIKIEHVPQFITF
jgi:hypothetical protein